MSETRKTIAGRIIRPDFDSTPLTDEQIKTVTKTFSTETNLTGSAHLHFTVITDKTFIDELDSECMDVLAASEDKSGYNLIKEHGVNLFYNAPCMLMIASDGSHFHPTHTGMLCQVAASDIIAIGMESVFCFIDRVPLYNAIGGVLNKRLQIPDGYDCSILVLMGMKKN